MEFWGVEVKPGESLKVRPELFKLIHISQAALGEVKDAKEAKYVPLRVTVGKDNYVIGTLSAEDRPQIMFDLVFEKEFELSHGWKNGSVYFMGYSADDPTDDSDDFEDEDSEEEEEENVLDTNGKVEGKKADVKPDAKKVVAAAKPASSEKPNVAVTEPKKEEDDDSEDDSDEEDDSEDDDGSSDGPAHMIRVPDGPERMDFSDDSKEDDEDDDSEDDDESEEETPKNMKKRPAPSPKGAPGSAKKAKQATPEKTGGKKGPATPASAKQNGKPSFNGNKSNAQAQKSGGQFSGKKNFNAQQKNPKAKHGKK